MTYPRRPRSRSATLASLAAAVAPLVAAFPFLRADVAHAQMITRTENFNVNPNWDGHNNRSTFFGPATVTQSYGYSSNRIGGTINPTGEISYFAQNVSNSSFNTALTASGTLTNDGGGNSWIQFFNSATANEWRSANSLGLRIYGRGTHFLAYPEYGTSKWRAGADGFVSGGNEVQFPVNTPLNWSLGYNPAGNGGGGTITAVINGITVVKNLDPGHKLDAATFNRFGLGAVNKSYDSPGNLFLDNVSVNGGAVQAFSGSAPGWTGVNNNATYSTNNVRFRFDFGFSNTNHAGGAGAGEAGGNFFRGDSRQANTMAFYGDELDQTLSLNQPLHAHGKLTFKRGVTDSSVHFGFFHNTDSMRVSAQQANGVPENFVGAAIEGPSAEGHLFYPSYGTNSEGQNASGRGIGTAPYIYPDSTTHNWTLDYDPNGAGGLGQITVSLDGVSQVMPLIGGHKALGATFNRFGFITPHIDGNGQTVFIDDVTYTVGFGTGPQWLPNASGDWHSASNWTSLAIPNAVDAVALFGNNNTSGRTVFINSPATIGTLSFASPTSWLLAGVSHLTMQVSTGNAQVNVTQGTHKINLPLTIASNTAVTVSAGSQLIISDPVTVNAGRTLSHAGAGTVTYQSLINLGSGATVSFAAAATELASLAMADDATADVTTSLRVADGDFAEIRSLVQRGHNGGDWGGDPEAGGGGIVSSFAATHPRQATALGIGEDGGGVMIKYTFYGDADLDGSVGLDDFNQFLSGHGDSGGSPPTWAVGDFDYSGAVDSDDFDLFFRGLVNQGKPIYTPQLYDALSSFAAAEGIIADLAAVPEPSGALTLAIGTIGVASSRVRRRVAGGGR